MKKYYPRRYAGDGHPSWTSLDCHCIAHAVKRAKVSMTVVIVHLQAHRQLSSTSSILAATLARRASAALYASRT